jgi:hypothetical protein
MSDQPTPPGHVPGGDLPPPEWPPPDAPEPEWPASPESTFAWGDQPPIIASGGYGPGSGGQPAKGNRGLIIAIAVAAALVLVGGIVAAVVVAVDAVRDETPVAEDTGPAGPTEPAGGDRDDPSDVALDELLTLINESELAMIQFQQDMEVAPDVAAAAAAADEAASELGRIKGELVSVDATGRYAEGIEAVRETYIVHLEAWETYAVATAADVTAYFDESGEHEQAIGDSADEFVRALENELPDDVPADLHDFAEFILDRGFRPLEQPTGTLV